MGNKIIHQDEADNVCNTLCDLGKYCVVHKTYPEQARSCAFVVANITLNEKLQPIHAESKNDIH